MPRPALLASTLSAIAVAVCALAGASSAQEGGSSEYCDPASTQYDPRDLRRPDAPPIVLPRGYVRRQVTVAGFRTSVIERGPRASREAVVFMHGNPGNSLDFIGLLRSVPRGTRVLAFDIVGFGAADKPYDFPYDLAASRPLVDRAFRELGIDRMHLVGHDVGSVVGVDYAARHPERLASTVLIAGGILIGYTDHHFARIWKTPMLGEGSMRGVDREGFVGVLQAHNPRPLPREFVDRNYDYFDRGTRCAILKIYRAMPDLTELGREHAEALRPHDKPALVIWGDRDPFLPVYLAESNREGFPHADVQIFPNSGHWPFVDTEERTLALMSPFLRRHVGEQAGRRLRLTVSPRVLRPGRRTRVRARVTLANAPRQPVAGARVSVGRRSARTGRRGRAAVRVVPRRPGRIRLTARRRPLEPARVSLRVSG
jgi:pimeloyl-ACP methyl ester carboxylesterase